ncbi:RNA-directed RNA polymerase, putative [Penicillium digitatum]|uniref:RNA-dependent RNA polymerase n=3 Tax=Penicillium digitatum TaxID=36651 RepID=K9GNB7_PEND2|nr:RNA-directed RNA polymerase, putative [Penicillium digitatum Pd1]EKV12907.1 RNA-directed RNA polymerase, putative [Penicillium digitatum Pd1]EKV14681.1 RNA-directed RNA polymerase, putative [Penicillium digitatum PHI26]QQK43351.1 RNA-directed RNA polymerase, putative [Penicillium digitatum]
MDPTTPQHQKEDFRTFVTRVNVKFGLEIPLPGIESPSARERNNSLPSQIYKHIRPLFFNNQVDKRSLLNNLEEWVRGNLPLAGSNQNHVYQTNADRRARQRHQSEEPAPPLSLTGPEKDMCMKQLLALMEDEEYLLANGRVVNTKKRLAANSLGDAKGLSPKKQRFDDEDEDENFHTTPSSPVKGSMLVQSPLGKNGDGGWQSPEMVQVAFQRPRRISGTVNLPVNNQRSIQSLAQGSVGIASPTKRQVNAAPGRNDRLMLSPGNNKEKFHSPAKYSATFPPPAKAQSPQGQVRHQPVPRRVVTKSPSKPQGYVSTQTRKSTSISSPANTPWAAQSPARNPGSLRSPSKTPTSAKSPSQSSLRQMDLRSFGFGNSFNNGNSSTEEDFEFKKPTLYEKLRAASDESKRNQPANTSVSTTVTSSVFMSRGASMEQSFDTVVTEITEPMNTQSTYADSVIGYMVGDEMQRNVDAAAISMMVNADPAETEFSLKQEFVGELLSYGPFSAEESFSATIPLRFRYELERIGRAWGMPFKQILVGDRVTFNTQDNFWSWVGGLGRRYGRPLPERSPRRAWDAAIGDFKSDKHSEVVVLSGDLDWCNESEPGIFKLRLNPLKPERTCRFHRRFGSDRFLTLTIPAADQPPSHQKQPSYPSALRESIASWLTRNDHHCLGRTWRAFYVEEVKTKRKAKAEARFRVELFAIDGDDFDHGYQLPPVVAPPQQQSDNHTPMGVDALLEWHMPKTANANQSNCKLFQRISLGLSKTFATVKLKPTQVLRLRDDPTRTVMNDGCALISRPLANQICDQLGITAATPSCFQGRIAGAKGLWMVDCHQSSITTLNDDNIWVQISDSQLKIHPHPQEWVDPVDDEKLTFEVVNWAKPLHPVDLNIQLLAILEYGGNVKEYIAKLTRDGVQSLYDDFLEVLRSNSPVGCRALLQKLRPSGEDGTGKARRLEQWVTSDAESIIRFSEAGFAPRDFFPLRMKLRKFITWLLERHVEELKIQVPLSTYAYCIADPYGVLGPDEVHFGFSNNWRDPQGQFEDNLLDGVDVLVGRLPAHLPSDIQRRKAVWKTELRHFKDVIVFPTTGNFPLAGMLSGGDYDGDTPWICWDPIIVERFHNSPMPSHEYPVEHYGLTKHSVPMASLKSTEDFLESVFDFNLNLSNLGRCTVEHEKLAYDESINSAKAKELACLLGHLVDGRKGGVHLSEQAWKEYRKTISPKQRALPAYRNPDRRSKSSNIVDYLKFHVAHSELRRILSGLNEAFPENDTQNQFDDDLIRPWREADEASKSNSEHSQDLKDALAEVRRSIDELYKQWNQGHSASTGDEFSPISRQAAENAAALAPPNAGKHPLIHTWQNSLNEWRRLVASYAYRRCPNSRFILHAFGETLCEIKASVSPSRLVTNEVIACYRVNQKMVAHLTANELPVDEVDDVDEYEDGEAIEAMLSF